MTADENGRERLAPFPLSFFPQSDTRQHTDMLTTGKGWVLPMLAMLD